MNHIVERCKKRIDANSLSIPFQGYIDLTYRCNLNCRHCWLNVPSSAAEEGKELRYEEIVGIVSAARNLGCREWVISGGEPLLRKDFPDIFGYITAKCRSYILNTNGTLITPTIAKLLKRYGVTLVALYGADAGVQDAITRQPGSFDATLRGMNLLKEAGVNFIVQIVPMRDNHHQLQRMIDLALSICSKWRLGAAWLHLSASGDEEKNREIIAQRLSPKIVAGIDGIIMSDPAENDEVPFGAACKQQPTSYLLEKCIST